MLKSKFIMGALCGPEDFVSWMLCVHSGIGKDRICRGEQNHMKCTVTSSLEKVAICELPYFMNEDLNLVYRYIALAVVVIRLCDSEVTLPVFTSSVCKWSILEAKYANRVEDTQVTMTPFHEKNKSRHQSEELTK